jgi:hypothetical protein
VLGPATVHAQAIFFAYLQNELYLGHLPKEKHQSNYTNLLLGVLTLSKVHKYIIINFLARKPFF